MKTRNIISIYLLALYTLVLAHSITPHHHHSEDVSISHLCNHDNLQTQNTNHCELNEGCCLNHNHKTHSHTFCQFNGKTVLTKFVSLSRVYIPSSEINFIHFERKIRSFSDFYIPIQTKDSFGHIITLRGPPQFS